MSLSSGKCKSEPREVPPHTIRMGKKGWKGGREGGREEEEKNRKERKKIRSVDEDVEKVKPLCTVGENVK